MLTVSIFTIFLAGVPEQASDLGVGAVTAHWPRDGHREHTSLCRLQQTEYHTRRESHTHTCMHAQVLQVSQVSYMSIRLNPEGENLPAEFEQNRRFESLQD